LLRAVLDANIFVSALLRPEGPPGQVIEHFLRDRAFDIVLAPAIVDEVLRAPTYPKIRRLLCGGGDPQLWFEDILVLADLVSGELVLSDLCEDPDDDEYIAAAIEGLAEFAVTGDHLLLKLKEHGGARIVGPRVFLDALGV
jgi:putative PIN family toxin of toxin-antitoxin system